MTNVAILWHMHQPYYEDLATGEHVLPWVRMHALKDYYGMVALLREFPDVKLTFNLVPSLLVQLEAFAEERAHDWHLDLGLRPVSTLADNERSTMLAEFFHAPRGPMIDLYPRYAELLRKRDAGGGFTDADFLDLQVWHKLSWVDPFYLDEDPRVRQLIEKQRHFDEADKITLREIELEILRRVIPEYKAAAERGQAELSTSPFYHPILPLLCDTDIYLRTHPTATLPRPPFRHPEDAGEQLARARQCHRRLFGREPTGLWPPEGSVSDAVAALAAGAGFQWMATDETILGRTIGREFGRDGQGRLDHPELLYRPYSLAAGPSPIACLFRDHTLSDLIGFVYAGWEADAAASDLVNRLIDAGRRFSAATGGEEAAICIILDGENAWEHYPHGGRRFLRALYRKLSGHPELRAITMSEAAGRSARTLSNIFPGSWIDGNFYIWIGHGDDLRAWRQLREAREAIARHQAGRADLEAGDPNAAAALGSPVGRAVGTADLQVGRASGRAQPDRPSTALRAGPSATLGAGLSTDQEGPERAFQELLIAEGSDWFWWYGDDHSSEHDLEFDDLFRRHLRNVYQMLGQVVPEDLYVTNISTGHVPQSVMTPVGLLHPILDGRLSSYFEWLAAGIVETDVPSGTMTGSTPHTPMVQNLLFGFDLDHLYFRIDLSKVADESLRDGVRCIVNFTMPADRRLVLSGEGPSTALRAGPSAALGAGKRGSATLYARRGAGRWVAMANAKSDVAAGEIIEAAVPFADLGLQAEDPFAFFVSVQNGSTEVERHPPHRPIESTVPAPTFEQVNWKA